MFTRPKQPYKPVLFARGLVVVLIPLLCSTLLLLLLNKLWSSSDAALLEENNKCLQARTLCNAFSAWAAASANRIESKVQPGNAEKKTLNARHSEATHILFQEMGKFPETDRKNHIEFKRLERIHLLEAQALASLPGMDSSAGPDITQLMAAPKVFAQIYKLRSELELILNEQRLQVQSPRLQGDRTRLILRQCIYGYCLGNGLLAIFLCFQLAGFVSSRLRILMENAAYLSRNQTIPEKVSGNDEFSYLDRILREAAVRLTEAAEHRRSTIGMVAHDLRSPLLNAQLSLQTIEETDVVFSDDAFASFDTAFENLSSILTYVQELLDSQKRGIDVGETENSSPIESESKARLALIPRLVNAIIDGFLRPKVLQKSLTLIAIPLVFQTALLLSINQQVEITERIITRSRRLSDGIMEGQFIQLRLVRASLAEAIYVFSSNAKFHRLAKRLFKQIDQEIENIVKSPLNEPETLRLLTDSTKVYEENKFRIMSVKPTDPPEQFVKVFEEVSEVNSRSPGAYLLRRGIDVDRLLESEKLQSMEDDQNASVQIVSSSFAFSILANFALSTVLLIFFNRGIRQRLNTLMNNAKSLGIGEALKGRVPGSDEFAFLDLRLHHVEYQLAEAREKREEIIASIAREMRTPLQASQLALKRFMELSADSLPVSCWEYLRMSQRNIDKVLSLIDNLLSSEYLSVGRIQLRLSSCDASMIVDDAIASVSNLAKLKSIRIESDCNCKQIFCDSDKLIQVLVNFLSNAIKFSSAGTTIKITCSQTDMDLCLAVQDEGPGLDEITQQKVFEKFYQGTSEQKQQGFGLGLAICKLIVETHGGTIGVNSSPGSGATFWLELPISESLR